jgi:hypothetical protein
MAAVALVIGLVFALRDKQPQVSAAPAPPPVLAPSAGAVPAAPAPTPPPEAVPPSSPAPSAPPQLAAVTVQSVPSGATLVLDGAIVGTTPAKFPKPDTGVRTLELRLEGYQRETVAIGPDTQSVLSVSLRKRFEVVKPTRPPRAPQPAPATHRAPTRRSGSEVVDPWAN